VGTTTQTGATLELTKSFKTLSVPVLDTTGRPGAVREYQDSLSSTLTLAGGAFSWHVNPSTRPAVRGGRTPNGEPTPDFAISPGDTPTVPAQLGATGLATRQDIPFTVAPEHDNGYMTARIEWPEAPNANAADNYDLELYRVNDDESLTQLGKSVNSNGVRPFEELSSVFMGPGDYVLRVVNVRGVQEWSGEVNFFSPEPAEAYTLTCRDAAGTVLGTPRQAFVRRGESVDVGDPCPVASKPGKPSKPPKPPKPPRG